MICLYDYNYHLPKQLIAQKPVRPRDASRLLVVHGTEIEHLHFRDITKFFNKGDILVVNNTKVIANKLYVKKTSGAKADIIIEAKDREYYICRVNTRNPKSGQFLEFPGLRARIVVHKGDQFWLKFDKPPEPVLKKYGKLPQPNYIKDIKKQHYQTEFANKPGSLAAPTAGLHFTKRTIDKLKRIGVTIVKITLHISFGTFRPINDLDNHKMDAEFFDITSHTADVINNRKGRLVVCGTTTFKALESAANKLGQIQAMRGCSDLFIRPGHKFKVEPDMMITNFHFPKSTLLLFIAAYFGKNTVMDAYKIAVKKKYRFYSLGDASLFIKKTI